jgi:hypothetical protein
VVVQKGAVYLLVGVLGHTSEEVEATGVVDESELVLGSEQSHVLNNNNNNNNNRNEHTRMRIRTHCWRERGGGARTSAPESASFSHFMATPAVKSVLTIERRSVCVGRSELSGWVMWQDVC